MRKEKTTKAQTGLLLKALKTWTVDDLIGFARPADMPFDTYRQLRRLKNETLARRAAPRKIWISSPSIGALQAWLKDPKGFPLPVTQGTHRIAIHGQIGSRAQKN